MTRYDQESPAAIKADIERTRDEMSQNIDELQHRLSPETLRYQVEETMRAAAQDTADNVVEYVRSNTGQLRDSVVDTIKHHPLPTAIIGLGVGWLLVDLLRSDSDNGAQSDYRRWSAYDRDYGDGTYNVRGGYGSGAYGERVYYDRQASYERPEHVYGQAPYGESQYSRARSEREEGSTANVMSKVQEQTSRAANAVSETADTVGAKASHAADTVSDAASQAVGQVQERVGEAREQAAHLGARAGEQMQQAHHVMEEMPLSTAIAAFAIGAAVGLMLPATRRENRIMGEWRDDLVERGEHVASRAAQAVQEQAQDVAEKVKPELESAAEKVKEGAKQAGKATMESAKTEAEQEKDKVKAQMTDSSSTRTTTTTTTPTTQPSNVKPGPSNPSNPQK